jgi:hypothetical protein
MASSEEKLLSQKPNECQWSGIVKLKVEKA